MSMSQAVIPLEEGWKKLREGGVLKIQEILEDLGDGQYSKKITTDEYSSLYTTVYTMCTQKPPNNWSENLYQNYCEAIKDYLSSRILPHIKEKHDESMLKELVRAALPARVPIPAARARRPANARPAPPPPQVRRWQNHTLMIRFLSHVFKYLDRFYVKRLSLPELADVARMRGRAHGRAARRRPAAAAAAARAAAAAPPLAWAGSQRASDTTSAPS